MKHARRQNRTYFSDVQEKIWNDLLQKIQNIPSNPKKKLQELHAIHKKYMELDYIKTPLGDLSNQIDTEFSYP